MVGFESIPRWRGMSYGFRAGRGDYEAEAVASDAAAMQSLGIDAVALHISLAQETFASTRVFADFAVTPSDDEIRQAIRAFRARGLAVLVKPMIECQDSAWQGTINFPDQNEQIQGVRTDYWSDWFRSFGNAVTHYAQLAQSEGAEIFCVGCELVGTLSQADHWLRVIGDVRTNFHGLVTFDTDHTALEGAVPWFTELDLLSVSYYVPAAEHAGASVDEMVAKLRPSVSRLRSQAEQLGLPILFGECGCRSRAGAATLPNDYQLPGVYSGSEQADYLDSVLRSFWPENWWAGMFWWKWDERQSRPHYTTDPAGDMGFTVRGKPAEETLARWYAHPV
jgi:hypothetical protein